MVESAGCRAGQPAQGNRGRTPLAFLRSICAENVSRTFTGIWEWWRRAKKVPHCGLFCVQHQGHSIVSSLLNVLDNFSWGHDDRFHLPTRYFTGVASISNVWRSTGAPAKIKETAVRLFNDEVVSMCFSHMLGSCLRGRWLSIDGVQSIISWSDPKNWRSIH